MEGLNPREQCDLNLCWLMIIPIGSMYGIYLPTFGYMFWPMLANFPYMEHMSMDHLDGRCVET